MHLLDAISSPGRLFVCAAKVYHALGRRVVMGASPFDRDFEHGATRFRSLVAKMQYRYAVASMGDHVFLGSLQLPDASITNPIAG